MKLVEARESVGKKVVFTRKGDTLKKIGVIQRVKRGFVYVGYDYRNCCGELIRSECVENEPEDLELV